MMGSFYVKASGSVCMVKNIEDLPFSGDAVLVLGAKVYPDSNRMSDVLKDRVDTGLEVYRAGKANKILVSGDNGQEEYDEVNVMKNYLVEKDVAHEDLFMDHAGFDTYDSVFRAKNIFGINDLIIVTQEFHLPRALYIARSMDINVCGVIADKQKYRSEYKNLLREIPARNKAFFDVLTGASPKYLGNTFDINSSGFSTWD